MQQLTYTDLNEKLLVCREEGFAYVDAKVDTITDSFYDLKVRIEECEESIQTLQATLRSVMDAKAEKPKQKWLWEIFEPNDINIDFPYNL